MGVTTIDINISSGEQSIFIPQDMRINDDKVYIKKIGNTLYIIPYHTAWQNLIESTDFFTQDFMESRNQPEQQLRDSFE